jgi:hypothetical protein
MKIQLKALQAEFGTDDGELFQTFLCICNSLVRGCSYKQVMDSIGNNSTIHSNVMQFFAAVGIEVLSGRMGEMIDEANSNEAKV